MNCTISTREPPPFLVTFAKTTTSGDPAREYVPRVWDLTPTRHIPRARVAPDLPRSRGRHPLLRSATFEQLKAIASYRKRDGHHTIYARRAATAVLRALERAETERRRTQLSPRQQLQRILDRASQLQVMLRASRSRATHSPFPGTLVAPCSRLLTANRSQQTWSSASHATSPHSPRRSSPPPASRHPPPWPM